MKTISLTLLFGILFTCFGCNSIIAQLSLTDFIPVELGSSLTNSNIILSKDKLYKEIKNNKDFIEFQQKTFSMCWKNADSVKHEYKRYACIKSNDYFTKKNNTLDLYFADNILYREFFQIIFRNRFGKECKEIYYQNAEKLKANYSFWENDVVKDKDGNIVGEAIEFRNTKDRNEKSEKLTIWYETVFQTEKKTQEKSIIGYCLWIEKVNYGITKLISK